LAEERRLLHEIQSSGTGNDSAAGNAEVVFGRSGRVRKAYSAVDRLSLKMAAIMRRFPAVRVFALVYMVRQVV
jgi:hypothetical protein